MSTNAALNLKRGLFTTVILTALLVWAGPAVQADPGNHVGGKPDIGQGDGIPQTKPGTIRAGEQKQDGDSSQGDDPAQDGGDGIPNGGPIEGEEHGGAGQYDLDSIAITLARLFFLQL